MKQFFSIRMINLLCLAAIVIMFGAVAYLEKFKGFEPCPLCILQRFALTALGITFLVGILVNLKKCGGILQNIFAILFASVGASLAGRQIWLQHLPPNQSSDCGASLEYMLQVLPWNQVLQKVLEGTAECSKSGMAFLSMNLAEWSLIVFCGFIFVAIWQAIRFYHKSA